VLKAIDEKLQRVVAIKVMAPQLAANVTARKRFTREAQAAAAVRHENVIGVHAVEEANGIPYLVMEYLSGVSLQQRLDHGGALELPRILRIGMQTASGLAAAHAQGLIHRDIKPANILLENGVERVKITDFGLARAVDNAGLTQAGVVAGTPQFMAPEQALGEPINQRADLFSLGSVLYAMCTGRSPFPGPGSLATLKQVCEVQPQPIREINPEIPEWLAAIVARLQAKKPGERFASAAEVAELLGKHLAHLQQPGQAPMPPPLKTRRSPGPWTFLVAALVLALAGLGVCEALGVTRFLGSLFQARENTTRAPENVTDGKRDANPSSPSGPRLLFLDRLSADTLPPASRLPGLPKEVVAVLGENRRRHWWSIRSVAYSPDGKLMASAGEDSLILVADAETMCVRTMLRGHTSTVYCLAFAPNSRRLLSCSEDGTIRLWDLDSGTERLRFDGPGVPSAGVAFSPDGKQALSGSGDGIVRLWNVSTGKEEKRFEGHKLSVIAVAFAPDGKRGVSGGGDATACVWDLEAGTEVCRFDRHTGIVHAVAFLPDGKQVLSANREQWQNGRGAPAPDYTVRLWDAASGKEVQRCSGHDAGILTLALSADGCRAVSAGVDRTLRWWDVAGGRELARCDLAEQVWSVALSKDGTRAITGGDNRQVRIWDLARRQEVSPLPGHIRTMGTVAFSADARYLVSGSWEENLLRLWDLETGKELPPFKGHKWGIWCAAFSRDGKFVFSGSGDKTLRKWEIASRKEEYCLKSHSGWVTSLALTPDGRRALTGTFRDDTTARWWDIDKGAALGSFQPSGGAHFVTLSPDGRWALTGGTRHTVCLWEADVETPRELRCFEGHTGTVICIAFAPDGKSAASCGGDGMIWLWSLTGAEPPGRKFLKYHTRDVRCVAFTLDGKHLVSSGCDGRVILWDVASGDRLREWRFPGYVCWVAFAPDGRHLATANSNGTIYILRLPL
jgi:WD40 repeat protein/serine/threonine protein kinase